MTTKHHKPRPRDLPRMPQAGYRALLAVWTIASVLMGVEILADRDTAPTALVDVAPEAMSATAWGSAFIAAAIMVAAGVALRFPRMVTVGATLSAALNAGVVAGILWQAMQWGYPPGTTILVTHYVVWCAVWAIVGWGTPIMQHWVNHHNETTDPY